MSLEEAMIPWWGGLKFGTCNPQKITKYGVTVWTVCEAVSGFICKMKIYADNGQKLEDTVLDRN